MLTPCVQRWRGRRDSYRPAGEVICTRRYEVAPLDVDAVAKAFVVRHHYSGTYPAARFRFGLYRGTQLQGVAVFSHPCNDAVLTRVFPDRDRLSCTELGRLVLLDEVPANGETWLLGRCFEMLRREGVVGVVSFADPEPRSTAGEQVVFGGHVGTIYQAHNAAYLGRTTARQIRLLPDGRLLGERAVQKLRRRERGWRYVAQRLATFADDTPPTDEQALLAWAQCHLGELTRRVRHGGNHRYAWGLNSSVRRALPTTLPYPKLTFKPDDSSRFIGASVSG